MHHRRLSPPPVSSTSYLGRTMHTPIGGGTGFGLMFLFYFNACIFTEAPQRSSPSTSINTNGCPKCGTTKKSGKLSCCARGGAWFKNCGDAGDTKFDHTWAEGIQACQGFTTSISVKSALQADLLHNPSVIAYPINTALSGSTAQKFRTNIYRPDSVLNTVTTNTKTRVELTKIIVCICVFLTLSHL